MTAIERLIEKLEDYPALHYRTTNTSIEVEPTSENGFAVDLCENGNHFTVGFGGWHEEFDSESEALNCFLFGLSDQCRLRVDLRGNFEYRWTVESQTDSVWHADSTTGLLFFPFWRRPRTVYRQNGILKFPKS